MAREYSLREVLWVVTEIGVLRAEYLKDDKPAGYSSGRHIRVQFDDGTEAVLPITEAYLRKPAADKRFESEIANNIKKVQQRITNSTALIGRYEVDLASFLEYATKQTAGRATIQNHTLAALAEDKKKLVILAQFQAAQEA